MQNRIDYSKHANDILWQCLKKATNYILNNRKHLILNRDERHDLELDIEIFAHKRVMDSLHSWNTNFPFFNFVYWNVWSCSGQLVNSYLKRKMKRYNSDVSLDAPEADGLTEGSRPLYLTKSDWNKSHRKKVTSKKAQATRAVKALQEDYEDYLGYCAEFGVEPITFEQYSAE